MRRLAVLLLAAAPFCLTGAERIVSTTPSLTEVLYELGLGPQVVGVTTFCRHPEDARAKPKVGTYLQPDIERILALKPTLVLVIRNPSPLTANLRRVGLRVEEVNHDDVNGILESMTTIGRLTGRQEAAGRVRDGLTRRIEAVRRAVAGRPRRSVLFLVGRSPGTLQGMVGAGARTFIDELMGIAGGRNVLAGSPIQYPRVTLETVLAGDPEFILDMGDFAHAQGRPGQPEHEVFSLWSKYPRLQAVRKRQVRVIGSEIFIRPGPRLADAVAEFQKIFHPETVR